ncbi:MAG: hydroxymethylbilane synthase [Solirubrobacterales bacterium]
MRIGTRASALALAQAELVAQALAGGEVVPMVTSGDRGAAVGDKSRWVAELERALADGEIDLAVHSAKDLPGELADGLALAGAPARARAEDVLCGADSLQALSPGASVGTSSVRRAAQLRAAREDVVVVAMRGNVDTRLHKLERGDFDAIVLARAGLQRLGREDSVGGVLDPAWFVPAPGQGTLALEARAGDARVREALAAITDADAFACLLAERALAQALDASCHTPLGAHAALAQGGMRMRAWVGLPDGSAWVSDELEGDAADPEALGREIAERIKRVGGAEILSAAERWPVSA